MQVKFETRLGPVVTKLDRWVCSG